MSTVDNITSLVNVNNGTVNKGYERMAEEDINSAKVQ
jgi:hypothetical protein